jgi:uncharacterized damage-inducible protein DinB
MTFVQRLLAEYDDEMKKARTMLERVPEDKLTWKPHEKSMTLGKLASHVADFPNWALTTVQVDTLDFKASDMPAPPTSRADILQKFAKDLSGARQAISGLTEEQLGTKWTLKFEGQEIFSMPRADVLRLTVMNHLIHHRAQLSVYLRLLDVAVPGMYGPSADEMAATAVA